MPNMLSMGWALLHMSPASQKEVFLFGSYSHPKIKAWGEEGGHRKPGMREDKKKKKVSSQP